MDVESSEYSKAQNYVHSGPGMFGIRTGGTSTMAGKAAVGLGQARIMGTNGKCPGTVSVGIY